MNTVQIKTEIEQLRKDINILEVNFNTIQSELMSKKTKLERDLELLEIKGIDVE